MRITDEQIAQFKKDGFLIVENFLTTDECEAALSGFHKHYGPPYEEWLAAGKQINVKQQKVFPWNDSGLNYAITHPDLIDAAERIIGTREIRLSEGHLSVKYYGMEQPPGTPAYHYHQDLINTLGPVLEQDDFQHIFFFYCFDDVTPGLAPIMMVPHGKPFSEAVPMIVPRGSICLYTPFTFHSSSEFKTPGHRFVGWAGYSRKDRLWDGARAFTYKGGATIRGMNRFIADATPRQLELIGFPPVGDELWTDAFLEGMKKRYPGFNPEPYRSECK